VSGTTPFDCPRCGAGLTMSERQGIEIDYCPQCRGVWLDRGELDKIIERTGDVQGPPPSPPPPDRTGQGVAGGWTRPATPRPNSSPGAGTTMATATGTAARGGSPGWRRSSTEGEKLGRLIPRRSPGRRVSSVGLWSLGGRGATPPRGPRPAPSPRRHRPDGTVQGRAGPLERPPGVGRGARAGEPGRHGQPLPVHGAIRVTVRMTSVSNTRLPSGTCSANPLIYRSWHRRRSTPPVTESAIRFQAASWAASGATTTDGALGARWPSRPAVVALAVPAKSPQLFPRCSAQASCSDA
jgi:uncharacterized protein